MKQISFFTQDCVSHKAMAKSSINQKLQEKAETRTLTDLSAKNSESLSVDSSVSKDHLNAGAIESIAVTTLNPVLDSDHKVIHHDHEEGEDDHHDHDSLIKTPIGGKVLISIKKMKLQIAYHRQNFFQLVIPSLRLLWKKRNKRLNCMRQ